MIIITFIAWIHAIALPVLYWFKSVIHISWDFVIKSILKMVLAGTRH